MPKRPSPTPFAPLPPLPKKKAQRPRQATERSVVARLDESTRERLAALYGCHVEPRPETEED